MIRNYYEKLPKIHADAFIADSSDVIGNVEVAEGASVWFKAVLRGDISKITIGKNSNVQDGVVIHGDENLPVTIGENVTIGHNAIIHGTTIGNNCLIGMGSVVLNGSVIGENSIIGAGAIVTGGKEIPANSLVLGAPGKVVRTLTDAEVESIKKSAELYCDLANGYK